jgi:hypothetical protein
MDQTIFVYDKIKPSTDLVEEVFSYNFKELDQLSGANISKYCAALAQYLVYLRYQRNKTKMDILKLKQRLDRSVFLMMDKDTLKRFKTKSDAREYIISGSEALTQIRSDVDKLDYELILSKGMDKNILELINALKRELTRRSEEFAAVKINRR